jgi:hypothetical protein
MMRKSATKISQSQEPLAVVGLSEEFLKLRQ